jgi:hypothetical protein
MYQTPKTPIATTPPATQAAMMILMMLFSCQKDPTDPVVV